jgi:The  BURPS668_1122 family of deaminases
LYNCYSEDGKLPDHFGNFATLKGGITLPNGSYFDLNLFSFSQEETFYANNNNIIIDYESSEHRGIVLSNRIVGNKFSHTLGDAVTNNFTHKINKIVDRNTDTEFKLLEYLCKLFADQKIPVEDFEKIIGEIILESERSCCESCNSVIIKFKKLFPNIKLTFRSYFGDQNSLYTENGITFVPTSIRHSKAYEGFLTKSLTSLLQS